MGVMASASSVLSCFLNSNSLTKNAETYGQEGKKEEDALPHNEGIGLTKDTAITFAQIEGLHHGNKDTKC